MFNPLFNPFQNQGGTVLADPPAIGTNGQNRCLDNGPNGIGNAYVNTIPTTGIPNAVQIPNVPFGYQSTVPFGSFGVPQVQPGVGFGMPVSVNPAACGPQLTQWNTTASVPQPVIPSYAYPMPMSLTRYPVTNFGIPTSQPTFGLQPWADASCGCVNPMTGMQPIGFTNPLSILQPSIPFHSPVPSVYHNNGYNLAGVPCPTNIPQAGTIPAFVNAGTNCLPTVPSAMCSTPDTLAFVAPNVPGAVCAPQISPNPWGFAHPYYNNTNPGWHQGNPFGYVNTPQFITGLNYPGTANPQIPGACITNTGLPIAQPYANITHLQGQFPWQNVYGGSNWTPTALNAPFGMTIPQVFPNNGWIPQNAYWGGGFGGFGGSMGRNHYGIPVSTFPDATCNTTYNPWACWPTVCN